MTLLYHGTRDTLHPGDLIVPLAGAKDDSSSDWQTACVFLTPKVDEATWDAELASGEGPPHVYIVEATGSIDDVTTLPGYKPVGRPSMSRCSRDPLRVVSEVTEWPLYHGTRVALKPGDLIKPGHAPNYGNLERTTTWVYFSRTLDAATWGAELAAGEGPGRIYIVEPTGPYEDDPNLTNRRFRGNPTKSFRSRAALRVTGEIEKWQGHPPEAIKAMNEHLARLKAQGIEPLDD